VNVPVAAVALVLGARVLPESTSRHRAAPDVVGAVLSTLAVLLVLLPLVQGRDWGWPWWGFALMAAGVLVLAGFVVHERSVARRGARPVLDPALLRVRSFSSGLVASVIFFGAIGAFFLTLSIYLQAGTGRTAWQTGLVLLPYALGSIVTSGLGVALAARAGRALLISGSLTLAGSLALLWFLVRDGQNPGYWMLALALFIGGLGLGLTAPILVNVVLAGVPAKDAGAAGGALSAATQIGGAAGIAVLGTIFFAALQSPADDNSRLIVFGNAFAAVIPVEIALYLLGAALMLLLPKAAATVTSARQEHHPS
jgi:predicted MFS family arabinose efflux permease